MEKKMGKRVVKVIAHHAITPLADGSHENYRLIKEGHSAVQHHSGKEWELAEDFMAGLIATPLASPRATTMALHSIRRALQQLAEPLPLDDTLLIISTTKGNINLINGDDEAPVRLGAMAEDIAHELGLTMRPLVVSNACTSGVCAQVAAQRALTAGLCHNAIVCGVEAQSRFIVSGFQSFHALAPDHCRPFSANREGLNVGEAAATMVYTLSDEVKPADWILEAGAIRNDANHISGPSRTGEGSYRALRTVMAGTEANELAFVSVHGTATPYNDEMESIAIDRAGLLDVPVCSLKGYYGHTMGAAGVLETILSMEALEDSTVPATLGYDDQLGVSHPVAVASTNRPTNKQSFIKLISGFGGCNAAIRMRRGAKDSIETIDAIETIASIIITPSSVILDGEALPTTKTGDALITECYRNSHADYPKYFKMDPLSRLGFVASELLLQNLSEDRFVAREDRAVVLASCHGCLHTDRHYESTIVPGDNYFPSPSVFVYTLPNIVTGEIAIRNHYLGETSMYLFEESVGEDERLRILKTLTFQDPQTTSAIIGWVDYQNSDHFLAKLYLVNK